MISKNTGKPLTADLVFTKTKSDSLHNIKNLNLWGNDLEDLSLIEKMPNLQVISLSVNRISSLKDFSECQKLQELYLRKNNISDLREIKYLINLPTLKVLWLHDNPCAQIEHYREIVIKYLPNLVKLDNNQVTAQERSSSQNISYPLQQYQSNNESNYKSQKVNYHPPIQQYSQQKKPRPSSNYYQAPVVQMERQVQRQPQYNGGYNNRGQNMEKAVKKTFESNKRPNQNSKQQEMNRNQNILMAVLSLMRELDQSSLEIVKRQAQKLQRAFR